jgi:phosphatidylglycerophosphatase A
MSIGNWIARMLASGFFLSYLPVSGRRNSGERTGAGLIGSAIGIASAFGLPAERLRATLVLLGAMAVAIVISDIAEGAYGHKDDQRIVIDEWVGVLVAVAFFSPTPWVLALGFVLFRLFDVFKPLGIARLQKWPGGWGIVMDDVLAGVYANLCLRLLRSVHPF